jgi:hypothetical protein
MPAQQRSYRTRAAGGRDHYYRPRYRLCGGAGLVYCSAYVKASPTHAMRSTGTISLQRSQEFDNRLLICRAKVFKAFGHVISLAAVAQDSVAKCQRGAIVHQHWLEAYSP